MTFIASLRLNLYCEIQSGSVVGYSSFLTVTDFNLFLPIANLNEDFKFEVTETVGEVPGIFNLFSCYDFYNLLFLN